MLKVAIPNKGALSEDTVRIILDAGYHCRRRSRELVVSDADHEVKFIFLRPRDIAVYIRNGILDMGITGRDLMLDSGANLSELLPLGFGHSRFCYAAQAESDFDYAPSDDALSPERLYSRRIATSYPRLLKQDLDRRGVRANIIPLDGAVEIAIGLGVADLIADVVQSGRTLREMGLVVIGDPILHSEAVLVARTPDVVEEEAAYLFVERIRGIVVAREYVMIEYDIPKSMLTNACNITPGIESPTVSPLSKKGWVAVKSMSRRKDANLIMDRLVKIGAKGIIVTDIRTCRL